MFSVVMATLLSTSGAATPAWCHGCWGSRNGCWGGRSCHGCAASCAGCYGWAAGAGCAGCWGGGLGCSGCYGTGCHGWGSCYGGCAGCYGSRYGCVAYGCYGAGYGYSCLGSGCAGDGCGGVVVGAVSYETPISLAAAPVSRSATIVVELPAEAKLYVDGYLSKQTTAIRTIATPELDSGTEYTYTLKAEMIRDGQVVTQTRQVSFRAGATVRVDLHPPAAATVAQR